MLLALNKIVCRTRDPKDFTLVINFAPGYVDRDVDRDYAAEGLNFKK
jgi:hypothetical protein